MNRVIFAVLMILALRGEIYDTAVSPAALNVKKNVTVNEPVNLKHDEKSRPQDPYMDGVVIDRKMEVTKDAAGVITYTIYIRTGKGEVKKFRTTEYNYFTLGTGYSVHYVLEGSGRYKLVSYKPPE